MKESIELVEQSPTVKEYQVLRRSTGWAMQPDQAVRQGLDKTLYSVCALASGRVVGCARVVGDGALYFYVQDLIVLREHQGRGIGRMMMDKVMAWLDRNAGPDAFVGLMAAKGYSPFYDRYGFQPRPGSAPGMYLVRGDPGQADEQEGG
jgi:GNAT superfamily N-acetyltransferase